MSHQLESEVEEFALKNPQFITRVVPLCLHTVEPWRSTLRKHLEEGDDPCLEGINPMLLIVREDGPAADMLPALRRVVSAPNFDEHNANCRYLCAITGDSFRFENYCAFGGYNLKGGNPGASTRIHLPDLLTAASTIELLAFILKRAPDPSRFVQGIIVEYFPPGAIAAIFECERLPDWLRVEVLTSKVRSTIGDAFDALERAERLAAMCTPELAADIITRAAELRTPLGDYRQHALALELFRTRTKEIWQDPQFRQSVLAQLLMRHANYEIATEIPSPFRRTGIYDAVAALAQEKRAGFHVNDVLE